MALISYTGCKREVSGNTASCLHYGPAL